MDLYISPMSCSFAAHVSCLEAGIEPDLHRVDRTTKRLDDGTDFRTISPLAIVPVIRADGWTLGESSAVLQYIADCAPQKRLAPPWGTPERYHLQQWLNFTTSELHKKHLWPIFSSKTNQDQKAWSRANIAPPLEHVARHLADREYLVGDTFTVADAYMFWALFVLPHGGVPLDAYPALDPYVARIRPRPTVAKALAYEVPLFQREAAQAGGLVAQTQAPALQERRA
jgi:glutathione S-transferase